MLNLSRVVKTFPSARISSQSGGLAVEVSLIAQLGHGAGNHLFNSVSARQRRHDSFIDELDEPSAKLGSTNFAKGDATSLYSFVVGPNGHPFHRHAGHRVFTAISGSGGAQLRFSSASTEQITEDPRNFIRALRFIDIPADCLFTVRFGGETWHQFAPRTENSRHPVFFALSCHTNELGGNLSSAQIEQVLANDANIPALTELLSPEVAKLLRPENLDIKSIPVTTLSLDAPAGTLHRLVCNAVRSSLGWMRGKWAAWKPGSGFLSYGGSSRDVTPLTAPPENSLLRKQLEDVSVHHQDTFRLRLTRADVNGTSATRILALVLDGFLHNAPSSVTSLMALRNVLVKPLGLRTSHLGCPVSSLLSPSRDLLFANRYPVLDQSINASDKHVQVILGANDKHLIFRSCVSVEIVDGHHIDITLGTRVHCKNLFGHFYMAAIDYVHRRYVSPTMLRLAVEHAAAEADCTDGATNQTIAGARQFDRLIRSVPQPNT